MKAVMLAIMLILVTLATGTVVDVWRNGSLFARRRAAVEAYAELYEDGWYRFWWAGLLSCDFCFSTLWAPALVTLPTWVLVHSVGSLGGLPLFLLAVSRAAWVLNGLLPGHLRYDRATTASTQET